MKAPNISINGNMRKCTILANPRLTGAYLAFLTICHFCLTFMLIGDTVTHYYCAVLWIALMVTACCSTKRWCLMISFTSEGINYKPLFRKTEYRSYRNYPCTEYAYYKHGNIFAAYKVHYFVLTNKRMNTEELSHINLVDPSIDLIK